MTSLRPRKSGSFVHWMRLFFYFGLSFIEIMRKRKGKERKIRLLKNLTPFCIHLHKLPLLSLVFPKIQTKATESIFVYFNVLSLLSPFRYVRYLDIFVWLWAKREGQLTIESAPEGPQQIHLSSCQRIQKTY
mgnify:CR=1 FL=1